MSAKVKNGQFKGLSVSSQWCVSVDVIYLEQRTRTPIFQLTIILSAQRKYV